MHETPQRGLTTAVTLACAVIAGLGSSCGFDPGGPPPPEQPIVLEIRGRNFQWHARDAGPDGVLGSPDDVALPSPLVLPADCSIRLELRSDDYLYTLAIPEVGVKEIAVPDLEFAMAFTTPAPGTLTFKGDQMCGYAHADLIQTVRVVPWGAFHSRSAPPD